ncbi:MAG: hypothetical protein AAGD07_23660 [Planctomycetota bacterium]
MTTDNTYRPSPDTVPTDPGLLLKFANQTPTEATTAAEPESVSSSEEEVSNDGFIIVEAAAMLDDLEEIDFDDVPLCSCGRYCDSQTLDDAWHCSRCDPNADRRRKQTLRLLKVRRRLLKPP